ncbi:MAG: hypothetical protein M3041_05230 [Acidobacteriota bacterium]|nr:hypothetical protein [Acidobacteriota bacterium]
MHFITAAILLLAAAWPQFGRDSGHGGAAPNSGQPLQVVAASVVMDPFADFERAIMGNDLFVHYATPLIDGDDVFVEIKGGTYTINDWSTQTWGVQALRWQGSKLTSRWTVFSDWKPVPFTGGGVGPAFEPVFQPVLSSGYLFMPGVGGSVLRVDRETGQIIDRFGEPQPLDSSTFVSGPIVADAAGSLYYNVIALARTLPWNTDVRDAWITRITPQFAVSFGHYSKLVAQAPSPTAECVGAFAFSELPWPPSPDAVPPAITCGSQRPGVNVAPAVAPDGSVYTISRTHFNSRYTYLVALDSTLTPKWSTSLRDRFNDGCNVLLPPNGTPGGCREGAIQGVDPSDNTPGAGRAIDDSSASPLIAPDGSVFYGAFTRYNYFQGHLMHFSTSGAYLGAYRFGWDITPAIFPRVNGYSIVTKENHYPVGSYCDDSIYCPSVRRATDPSGYFVTRLDESLAVEWQVRNPNNQEWCVNGPAIDRDGVSYVNAEDGFLYAIAPDGTIRESIMLTEALGQAYTPVAIDDNGRVYAEKAGRMFVVTSIPRRRAARK